MQHAAVCASRLLFIAQIRATEVLDACRVKLLMTRFLELWLKVECVYK